MVVTREIFISTFPHLVESGYKAERSLCKPWKARTFIATD
jgi:hypothetical protein